MARPTIEGPTFQERPPLCQEQPTFRFGNIERLADVVAAEVDPIDSFGQFPRETDTHPGCGLLQTNVPPSPDVLMTSSRTELASPFGEKECRAVQSLRP